MEPRSELARLRAGGMPLDLLETFVEVDGVTFSILINKEDLRHVERGTMVRASAIKVSTNRGETQ